MSFCESCSLSIPPGGISKHAESFHVGPYVYEEEIRFACSACSYQVSRSKLDLLVEHCSNLRHPADQIYVDFNKFLSAEQERFKKIIHYSNLLQEKKGSISAMNESTSNDQLAAQNVQIFQPSNVLHPTSHNEIEEHPENVISEEIQNPNELCAQKRVIEKSRSTHKTRKREIRDDEIGRNKKRTKAGKKPPKLSNNASIMELQHVPTNKMETQGRQNSNLNPADNVTLNFVASSLNLDDNVDLNSVEEGRREECRTPVLEESSLDPAEIVSTKKLLKTCPSVMDCKICFKNIAVSSVASAVNHMMIHSPRIKPWRCLKCPHTTHSKPLLLSHTRRVHRESTCIKSFATQEEKTQVLANLLEGFPDIDWPYLTKDRFPGLDQA